VRKTLIWSGIIALFSSLLLLSFSRAQTPDPEACVDHWEELSSQEQVQCAQVLGNTPQDSQSTVSVYTTTPSARPTSVPWSGLMTEEAIYEARGRPTIVTTRPPGVIPDSYQEIEQLWAEDTYGTELSPKYRASAWRLGAVLNDEGYATAFYISTLRTICGILTHSAKLDDGYLESRDVWSCPADIGAIKITDATGPTGIITFTSEDGQVGTFDLTTEQWTLNGTMWTLPSPGVIPDSYQVIEQRHPPLTSETQYPKKYPDSSSVWRVGAVLDPDYAYAFYVATSSSGCSINTFTSKLRSDAQNFSWDCPEDIGPIIITDATGPTGVITFTSEDGQVGTFDLTTEQWVLDGQPWVAATPVPVLVVPEPLDSQNEAVPAYPVP